MPLVRLRPTSPLSFLSQNVYVNINRIMSVANRLVESGHYASQQIKQIANQLEQEWKAFAAALDERSTLLDMSSVFHQKAEKVSACSGPNPDPSSSSPSQPGAGPHPLCNLRTYPTSLFLTFLIREVDMKGSTQGAV